MIFYYFSFAFLKMQSLITNYFFNYEHKLTNDFEYEFSNNTISIDPPSSIMYLNDSIQLIYIEHSDEYKIYAKKDILDGTLLVIEQGVINKLDYLINYLKEHENIANDLYPRKWNSTFKDKIDHNTWMTDTDEHYAMYAYLSKINHSCKPNAFLAGDFNKTDNMFLYSIKNIVKGTEIFISYGSDSGHTHPVFNWKCYCGMDNHSRRSIFNNACTKANDFWLKDKY